MRDSHFQIGPTRPFTLSPDTTDCDSNDLESEMSLEYETSLHSSSRIGATMPVLEDGLSSGRESDTEDDGIMNGELTPKLISLTEDSSNPSTSYDASVNPTLILMKKQISEIETEIKMRATHQHINGKTPVKSGTAGEQPSLTSLLSTMEGRDQLDECNVGSAGVLRRQLSSPLFDSNDPELEALDPMRECMSCSLNI
jgi:hypothetical protein